MRTGEAGFTYLVMLFAVAVAGVLVASGSVVWHQEAQRQREKELLRIGAEFRNAIGLYYHRAPGGAARYPERLEDLLRDDRHLSLERYLRRIYRDPMTGSTKWGLVSAPQGGVMGVYSLSEQETVKRGGFRDADAALEGARRYADWKFVYMPPTSGPSSPTRAVR